MSKTKFGNSDINAAGQTVPLKWGARKWGEDTLFSIFILLMDYLPKFITRNQLCKDILLSIAVSLQLWSNAMESLKRVKLKGGFSTFKYANSDLQLFVCNKISDSDIIYCCKTYLEIHSKRGSLDGIISDVKRLTGDKDAVITYYNFDNAGWYLGETYPMYETPDTIGLDGPCYLGIENLLVIKFKNKSGLPDEEVSRVISEEFVPLTINLRLHILKAHKVMWGEPKEGFKIQFGNIKFGEPIE